MLRRLFNLASRMLLGPAGRAGRQVLDQDARLALTPRTLAAETGAGHGPRPVRHVRHLKVYEGGRSSDRVSGDGPLGRPSPVRPEPRQPSIGAM